MVEEGEANTEIAKIWRNLPTDEGEKVVEGVQVDVSLLLPEGDGYFRFMGSLTTPPCSEGVNWHTMTSPIAMSREQIATFKKIYPKNARPLQPEHNRLVVIDN